MKFGQEALFVIVLGLFSCSGNNEKPVPLSLPSTFDSLPNIPADNQLNVARIELGRILFNEPMLSADGKVSCASCHKQALAFADTVPVSAGVHGKLDRRNSPSLLNVAYQKRLFAEGGIPNLEIQIMAPFGNENEMDFSLTEAARRLSGDKAIQTLSQRAYDRDLDGYSISRAIAAYERSLISMPSAYDRYMSGELSAISPAARAGLALFYSPELACSSCHSGFLFTDQGYHNIGLFAEYKDVGRARLTRDSSDIGKFKTPSLRNVAITQPYMHNGSIARLESAMLHNYPDGRNHPNRDARLGDIKLSETERSQLLAFLRSLTDGNLENPTGY